MAQKSRVTKEFSVGKNTYKVDEVKTFSDEITLKNADSLEEVVEKKKSTFPRAKD